MFVIDKNLQVVILFLERSYLFFSDKNHLCCLRKMENQKNLDW